MINIDHPWKDKQLKKYFVVHRYRQGIDIQYVKEFMHDTKNIRYHTSLKSASKELHNGFYDDSDYNIFSIDNKDNIERY